MENRWAYQMELEKNKVENKFNNFLSFLSDRLTKRKGAKDIRVFLWDEISHPLMPLDCAIVYNPRPQAKYPILKLYLQTLFVSPSETAPHLIMMATIANMIADKDPEFDALISKKIAEYISAFEENKNQQKI